MKKLKMKVTAAAVQGTKRNIRLQLDDKDPLSKKMMPLTVVFDNTEADMVKLFVMDADVEVTFSSK